MLQRVGTCSECGGDVMGYRGAWMSVNPSPADYCANCGGVAQQDIIKIHPRPSRPRVRGNFSGSGFQTMNGTGGAGSPGPGGTV